MESRYSSRYGYPRPDPAREAMPSSVGFTSMYGGDIHVMPTSSRYQSAGSRAYPTVSPPPNPAAAAAPTTTTTTTTYAVSKDPLARGSGHRESGRAHRSSTIDSAATRPVIVTTSKPRAQLPTAPHSHHASPTRDEFRPNDSFYTQPASSRRSRSHHRGATYGGTTDDYAYLRPADGLLSSRPDPYRPSRPAVLYAGQTRHNPAAIDYGDAGYEYTTPSDLARYDLSHDRPSRSRRRDSVDRNYHRPTVNVPTDIGRSYSNATGAAARYDNRGGPPPTTRGFDRISRGAAVAPTYDPNPLQASIPPPVPPAPAHLQISDGSKERAGGTYAEPVAPSTADPKPSRRRPVSVYQEGAPRSNHHEDYYRSREEDRKQRQIRDIERRYEAAAGHSDYFRDDDIATRGFGIRTADNPRTDLALVGSEPEERRESRRGSRIRGDDRRGGSDEEGTRHRSGRDTRVPRDDDRRRSRESSRPAKESKDPGQRLSTASEDEAERTRLRDRVGTGLGIAATALGFAHAGKKDETPADKSDKESHRRRSQEEERDHERQLRMEEEAAAARAAVERVERHRAREESARKEGSDGEARERHRRESDDRPDGEAAKGSARDGSPDEDNRAAGKSRRRRASSSFDPKDTDDLRDLREQLSNMKTSDSPDVKKEDKATVGEREEDTARTARQESPRQVPAPLTQQSSSMTVEVDDSQTRGREVVPRKAEEKQVRVVSPPREKSLVKPLKGILKQPRKFPEEENPVREGVAPHKDDKKLREVPPNARWTKISRRVVNPEALTIGKERFEVRDDFVIVLRVLSQEEIQAYATATTQLRGM
ncbi:hypothetical protein ACRALDRAFT_2025463 [Sodiomyces alcalophilus JCM 7366]|uniref:uncharacterized protein n=1 Tax=Sodiomyces alcalophilus JCM 7366 TaxID=591952 RepID=UPI0039B59568